MVLRLGLVCLALFAAACGEEIGDACSLSSDCSPQGDRICDVASPGGYCTVFGCDVGTCPEEAVCVRFFPTVDSNRPCDPATEDNGTDACTADEVCTLAGACALRSAEVRYCMRTCGSQDDCRDDYECRDVELMRAHGGEPVPEPGEVRGQDVTNFCAVAPI